VCHPYREDSHQRYLEIYIDILRWIQMCATPIEKIVPEILKYLHRYSPLDSDVCQPSREDCPQRYLEINIDILRWIHMCASLIEKIVPRDT